MSTKTADKIMLGFIIFTLILFSVVMYAALYLVTITERPEHFNYAMIILAMYSIFATVALHYLSHTSEEKILERLNEILQELYLIRTLLYHEGERIIKTLTEADKHDSAQE